MKSNIVFFHKTSDFHSKDIFHPFSATSDAKQRMFHGRARGRYSADTSSVSPGSHARLKSWIEPLSNLIPCDAGESALPVSLRRILENTVTAR